MQERMFRIYTNILFVWNQLKERMNRFKEILPPHTEKKETHPQLIALGIMLLSILIIDIMGYYHGNMTLLETLKNL